MRKMVQAGVFKAECLRIMEEVSQNKNPIIVTKHKVPIVKIVPMEDKKQPLFGKMKGTGSFKGDIYSSGELWNADS